MIFADKVERFWSQVARSGPDDCWEWQGRLSDKGYGALWSTKLGKHVSAHRVSWCLSNNADEVPSGLSVMHLCDNPPCVNPSHLRVGTHQENMADASRKGRMVGNRGSDNGVSKLTEAQVLEARHRVAAGEPVVALAAEYGVTATALRYALFGETWAHVGGPIKEPKPSKKLNAESARRIRELAASGMKQTAIARLYGVHFVTVSDVVRGVYWREAGGPIKERAA